MTISTLSVMPTQWGRYKDIEEVDPINSDDHECLGEIRDILKKYGKQHRFGVALLHKHFDIADDEMLVERTDKEGRVLTIRPEKVSDAGEIIETVWELGDGHDYTIWLGCRQYCGKDIHGNHNSFHKPTDDNGL